MLQPDEVSEEDVVRKWRTPSVSRQMIADYEGGRVCIHILAERCGITSEAFRARIYRATAVRRFQRPPKLTGTLRPVCFLVGVGKNPVFCYGWVRTKPYELDGETVYDVHGITGLHEGVPACQIHFMEEYF